MPSPTGEGDSGPLKHRPADHRPEARPEAQVSEAQVAEAGVVAELGEAKGSKPPHDLLPLEVAAGESKPPKPKLPVGSPSSAAAEKKVLPKPGDLGVPSIGEARLWGGAG